MKTKQPYNLKDHLIPFRGMFLALGILIVSTAGASAANLFWDAGNTNNGATIDPGSGGWDTDTTTNLNWNNGSGNVSWAQSATGQGGATRGAIFQGPGGAPNAYVVNVDGGQIATSNLTVNASGYMFTGSPIYLDTQNTASLPLLMVSNGVSVVFSNTLVNASLAGNNQLGEIRAGDNGPAATVVIYGTMTGKQWLFTSTNSSVFYLANATGTTSGSSTANVIIDADVRMTNGTWTSPAAFIIGRGVSTSQPNNSKGVLTLDGPNTTFNQNNDYLSVGRDTTWNSTLIVQNGATLNDQVSASGGNAGIGIPRPTSTPGATSKDQSWMMVYGGTVNMGTSANIMPIYIANAGSRPGMNSILTQTGGVINAWAGIQFGGSGTYDGGTAALTNSGGFLYLGAKNGDGLKAIGTLAPTNLITFSGGTIGALQSWHSTANLPITLDTLNGNVTFQCADPSGNPLNITLDQTLRGPGGFNKTGGGKLTLNNTFAISNTYAGSTVVSNGTLYLNLSTPGSTNGSATLDGSAGSPDLVLFASSTPSSAGQYWSVNNLTFAAGSPQVDFQYNSGAPGTTWPTIQVTGNLNFNVTPMVVVTNANALQSHTTYPLISYTGTLSGTAPTTVTLPTGVTGYVTNIVATKTVALYVITGFNPSFVWGVNTGNWDFTSHNWRSNSVLLAWSDNQTAVFDDTAPAPTNITVTLTATVSPFDVQLNNLTNAFTITGSGNISSGSMELKGGGTATLTATNTYAGGTTIQDGSLLNLNSSGSASGSPVGTGTLSLNVNTRLGNSSGSAVALQYAVPQSWNGNFSYVGNNDLDLGSGAVTLAQSLTVNVVTNNLEVDGNITDPTSTFQLTKTGNGTLTLAGANTWNGLDIFGGQVNLNASGAGGSGSVKITGSTVSVDNTSGADVVLAAGGYDFQGASAFTFLGTTNLDFGSGTIAANGGGITINIVSNTMTTAAWQVGNSVITKNGNGTWVLGGADLVNNAVVTINGGEFDMARDGGNTAVGTGGGGDIAGSGHGLVVNSNALAKITGSLGNQISHGSYIEVILNSGVLDLNGTSQAVDMISMTNGVLRNSAPSITSTLTITGTGGIHPTNAVTMNGTNCVFDVPPVDATLEISAIVNGAGTLVKTGLGTLTLQQSNTYTGNITVSAGTLAVTYEDIAATATVAVASNAVLSLNYADSGTNIIGFLMINGTNAVAGLHNPTTDPTFLTGSGNLLVVTPPPAGPLAPTNSPTITGFSLSGNNIVVTGTNGDTGATYYILDTTNVARPMAQWKTVGTNVAGGNAFSFTGTNVITPGVLQQFFRLSSTNYNP